MRNRKSDIPDEWVKLAYNLLSYLHRNDEVLKTIIQDAFCDLPKTTRQQGKRAYARIKEPKRIYLEDRLPLLQRLLLEHSEQKEREQEESSPSCLSQDDWSIRALAFATRESLKKNSEYAAIIWCCFIHDYLLREARSFHNTLRDDTEPHISDELFRKKKGYESDMFKKRFPNLQEHTQDGKEKYFIRRQNQDDSSLKLLVESFRNILRPWGTQCSEEKRRPFPPHKLFRKHVEYGDREIKRVHKFICPDCFRALTKGTSDGRLGLPELV